MKKPHSSAWSRRNSTNSSTPCSTKDALKRANIVAKGLPASPGAATGQIVFQAEDAEEWAEKKEESHPCPHRDISQKISRGMAVAQGIPHNARRYDIARRSRCRGMGKCCVSGAGEIKVDYKGKP